MPGAADDRPAAPDAAGDGTEPEAAPAPAAVAPTFDGPLLADPLLRWDAVGTAAFTVAATAAAIAPGALARPVAVFDVALFAVGTVTFLWAFALAVGRSREEAVSLGGVYFLAHPAAPARVRRAFAALLAEQCVVAVVTASIRVYTAVAFGALVPMLGLGLMGLWGARHAVFPPREPVAVAARASRGRS